MPDTLRDLADQMIWWGFVLLPPALLIDAVLLGCATYAFWRPDVAVWLRKKRQARILKKRFDIEIRRNHQTLVVIPRQSGKTYAMEKAYASEMEKEIERVSVKSWPYRPTKPQVEP